MTRTAERKTKITLFVTLVYSFCAQVHALSGAGTNGARFLDLGVSARSIAMGNAYTGVYWGGAISANHNPAGLIGTDRPEISLMHYQHITDSNFSYLGYARPLGNQARAVWAANFVYGYYGSVEETRVNLGQGNGFRTGKTFSGSDSAGTMSIAIQGTKRLGLGINVKYVSQELYGLRSDVPAGDFGLLYRISSRVSLGFAVRNIGPNLEFDRESVPLPLSYNAGVSYSLLKNDTLLFIADFQKLISQDPTVRLGAELNIGRQFHSHSNNLPEFSIRAGQDGRREAGGGMSLGAGVRIGNYSLDYAFTPFGLLGDAHRISASLRFGKKP